VLQITNLAFPETLASKRFVHSTVIPPLDGPVQCEICKERSNVQASEEHLELCACNARKPCLNGGNIFVGPLTYIEWEKLTCCLLQVCWKGVWVEGGVCKRMSIVVRFEKSNGRLRCCSWG
jgi:hypothetical protein